MDPKEEYQRRLAQRQSRVADFDNWDRRFSYLRLASGIAIVAVAWVALATGSISSSWIFLPVASLALLIAAHIRLVRQREVAQRAVAFYESGLQRLQGEWKGEGRFEPSRNGKPDLFSADLDLFGPGSLFERLSTARTRTGKETLARWLMQPASPRTVHRRQEAVRELRACLDLREDLAVLGEDVEAGIHPGELVNWASARGQLGPPWMGWLAPLLVVVSFTLLGIAIQFDLGLAVALSGFLLQAIIAMFFRTRVAQTIAAIDQPERDLELLSKVLARFEQERFESPYLRDLRQDLEAEGRPPSRQIGRLALLSDLLDSRRNQLFLPISWLLMWATQLAFAIESWRKRCGPSVQRWLEALGELEAIGSLAGYAYEHPRDPFPEIVEGRVCFDAQDLGHPLIAEDRVVRNSLSLSGDLQLMVVSGSNMSGKTTLLRTVGTNAVLAFAGAPVRARRLTLSSLAIGATLRVQDSLQEGVSRFYAEITKLRSIFDLTEGSLPVLFLLDEILHGTNSHDRAIGAEALVRSLVAKGAIGLVTTHDLALAKVAESLQPQAVNVHFEDHLEEGKLAFDYQLRSGIIRKSNALELMRAVGLEV